MNLLKSVRILFALVLVLLRGCCPAPLPAATVTGNLLNLGLGPLNTQISFTCTNNPQILPGIGIGAGSTILVTPVNGVISTNLGPGGYIVRIPPYQFTIAVPNDTNSHDIGDLATSGVVTYTYTNNLQYAVRAAAGDSTPSFLGSKLAAGNGILISTNNPTGNASLTISASSSLATLTNATNIASNATQALAAAYGSAALLNANAFLQPANNGSEFANKVATAGNVGVQVVPQVGDAWGGMNTSVPSFVNQVGIVQNSGLPYLVQAKSMATGWGKQGVGWGGGFVFYDACNFGDPTHMSTNGQEFPFVANGTSATISPDLLTTVGDNVMSWQNQSRLHYSAARWLHATADGGGEMGAIGGAGSLAPFYTRINYLEDFGTGSGFYFVGSSKVYFGMEASSGNFVVQKSTSTNAAPTNVVFRVDGSGNTIIGGNLIITGGVQVTSSLFNWDDGTGKINPSSFAQNQNISATRFKVNQSPAIDAGAASPTYTTTFANNGSGFFGGALYQGVSLFAVPTATWSDGGGGFTSAAVNSRGCYTQWPVFNNAGVTFSAVSVILTNTASSAGSLLAKFVNGGAGAASQTNEMTLDLGGNMGLNGNLSISGGVITNSGTIWLSTNATPTSALPNGSIATVTDGRFFVRSNSAWVLH